jgi:DNA-binding SARP family transcriptional activator
MLPLLFLAILEAFAEQAATLPPDYAKRIAALEESRQTHPRDMRVLDALAGSYTMGGEYAKAIAVLEQMRGLQPANSGLRLRMARNHAWAGDARRSIAEYRIYLRAMPGDRKATLELIRLLRYRGDYSEAETLCNGLLKINAEDAEVLALKAEVLHWAGDRRILASRTAGEAARIAADSPDAKVAQIYALRDLGENRQAVAEFAALEAQIARDGGVKAESTYGDAYRRLESELARPPKLSHTPAYSVYNDSDGIHDDFWNLRLAAPVRSDHSLVLDVSQRVSSAPAGSIFTSGRDHSSIADFLAGGVVRVAPAVYFTLLAGGSLRKSEDGVRPIFNFRIGASPVDRWTFDFSESREFLAVTPRAIDRDISSYKVAGGVRYAFDSRTSLEAHAERRYWSDSNRSLAGEATLRRNLHYYKPFLVDGGFLTHWEKFDRDTELEAGFFTPGRYRRHDGFLGLHGELKRLSYELRGAGGAQQVARAAAYRPDWEVTSTAGLRLSRSIRLSASYQRRNYSLLSRDGWYQGFYFSLGTQP